MGRLPRTGRDMLNLQDSRCKSRQVLLGSDTGGCPSGRARSLPEAPCVTARRSQLVVRVPPREVKPEALHDVVVERLVFLGADAPLLPVDPCTLARSKDDGGARRRWVTVGVAATVC